MTALLKIIDRICYYAAAVAAVFLAVLFVLGLSEIILRSAFRISLPFAVEYAGYLLVLILFLGSGWTLSQGGHIRVTLVSEYIGSRAAKRLDLICTVVGFCIAGLLSLSMIGFASGTWQRGTVSYFVSATPLAIPQMLLAMGLCILTLALFGRLLRLVTGEKCAEEESKLPDQGVDA